MSDWIARNRKFLIALLGAGAVIAAEIPADAPSWLTGLASVVTALAVWATRNRIGPDPQPTVVHTEDAGYPRTVEEQAEQLHRRPRVDKRGIDREPPSR